MDQEQWNAVDRYFADLFEPPDPALEEVLWASDAAGLPAIGVSPALGKLLQILARARQARAILEIGTLGGYSTVWLARALPPDGRLISLEADPKHTDVARRNIAHAGLDDRVEVRLGRAIETLPKLVAEGAGPFDFVFIDADKRSYPDYFTWSLRLSRRGTLIVADNVVRGGQVIDETSQNADVQGMRRFLAMVAAEPAVSATALQTVGSKGYDGFALILVTGDA